MNYYLKTTDEQSMWLALESAGLASKDYDTTDPANIQPASWGQDDGVFTPVGKFEWRFLGHGLDIIGVIYKPTGAILTNEDGLESPEMAPIDGFHANLKADAGIEGLPTIPAPATPYRKWAGE